MDEHKTKEQLIDELVAMRQRVAELEALGAEHKRAEEALRRQRDELLARSCILSATLRTTDLDELLGLILDEVVAFLGVEFASIHLVQADQVVLRAWHGLSPRAGPCLPRRRPARLDARVAHRPRASQRRRGDT